MKKWVCTVCGYVYEGENAPEFCPICKAPASKFIEQTEELLTERAIQRLVCIMRKQLTKRLSTQQNLLSY